MSSLGLLGSLLHATTASALHAATSAAAAVLQPG